MTRDNYPELTTEQYLNIKEGDTVKYLYYVVGDYSERQGKIKELEIYGNAVDDSDYYEYKYDNMIVLDNGDTVTYCDIIEVNIKHD